jgi:hypothetical protein
MAASHMQALLQVFRVKKELNSKDQNEVFAYDCLRLGTSGLIART